MRFLEAWQRFLENEDFADEFTDDDGGYDVMDMVHYAEKTKDVVDVPISKLMHNFEASPEELTDEIPGSPEFIERAKKADMKYPILIIKYDDGLWIADGVHRTWKAHHLLGQDSIKARILDQSELARFNRG